MATGPAKAEPEVEVEDDASDELSSAKKALCLGTVGLTFRSEGYPLNPGEVYEVAFDVAESSVIMWHWHVLPADDTLTFKASITPSNAGTPEADVAPEMRSQKHRSNVLRVPAGRCRLAWSNPSLLWGRQLVYRVMVCGEAELADEEKRLRMERVKQVASSVASSFAAQLSLAADSSES